MDDARNTLKRALVEATVLWGLESEEAGRIGLRQGPSRQDQMLGRGVSRFSRQRN